MSYILEALRRADSERDRGLVPGLEAQTFAQIDTQSMQARGMPLWAWLGAGGVLLCALFWAFGRWSSGGEVAGPVPSLPLQASRSVALNEPPLVPVEGIASASPAVSALNQSASTALVNDQSAAESPAAVQLPALVPPQVIPKLAKAPPLAKPKRTEERTEATGVAASPRSAAADEASEQTVALAAAPPTLAANAGSVPGGGSPAVVIARYQDLPPSVREQLPVLSVSGSVYTPQAKNRVLILNGQVFHEGDEPSAGLKLQHIKLKSAVFQFQGQVFEMAY